MRHNYQDCLHSLLKFFVLGITLVLLSARLQAAEVNYSVEISVLDDVQISGAQANDESRLLKDLLQQHLDIVKWRDNPRMSPAEWLRLYQATPQAIADLLATEGYFSPEITPSIDTAAGVSQARFLVNPGKPVLVNSVNINFTGDILQQDPTEQSARLASMATLKQNWLLPPGTVFKQSEWNQAKRRLLINLLVERYPNASIKASKAEVDPALSTVAITLEVDSGESFTFGELTIEGLQRYPASIIQDLNRIKPGTTYSQTRLQVLQSRLEESGYFQGVEVTASTATAVNDVVPVKVVVQENPSIKMGLGAGYSTNTGARAQLTYDDLNLFNRGWRLTSSLKPEQRAQSLSALVRLPTDSDGYRDSFNAGLERRVIEGQITTSGQTGINRSWGPRRTEQTIGAAYLIEHQVLDDAPSATKSVATLSYGITLRRTDNDRNPTLGYLFNTQFAVAPIEQLSSGRFLQSYVKAQGYYPITKSTQLIARAEVGMVNGKNSAPAAFLFRAGGDQSVRGYAFESLGVREGDAIVGGRYLATASVEVIQWITQQWGAALFVDAGNAANTLQDLKPVYGYGLGARWRSPIGAIGGDIAYGEATGEYRLHFNLGVAF